MAQERTVRKMSGRGSRGIIERRKRGAQGVPHPGEKTSTRNKKRVRAELPPGKPQTPWPTEREGGSLRRNLKKKEGNLKCSQEPASRKAKVADRITKAKNDGKDLEGKKLGGSSKNDQRKDKGEKEEEKDWNHCHS